MKTNVLTLIITLVVGTILAGALLAPVIADATKTTEVITNDGPRMSPLGEDTITVTYSADNWKINDRDLGFGSFPITQGTIMIFGQTGSNRAGLLYISENGEYVRNNVVRNGEYTWIYDGANKTVTSTAIVNDHTYTSSNTYLEEIYYNDPNGDYTWFGAKPTNAYIPENWDRFNAWSNEALHFYSIIGDTITVDGSIAGEGTTATLTTEDVPEYVGIKNITSYTLNIEGQDPITCRGYILPYQMTAELTDHLTPGQIALMNAIPVMVIVALLMAAIGAIALRRAD